MTDDELKCEARKQRRLEVLGTNEPRCAMCPETAWQCMELHHVAGQHHDETTVILCRNCHRKVSDDQKALPQFDPDADPILDPIRDDPRFKQMLATAKKRLRIEEAAE